MAKKATSTSSTVIKNKILQLLRVNVNVEIRIPFYLMIIQILYNKIERGNV